MSRPYTGFDQFADRTCPAVAHLAGAIVWNSAGKITNLGAFGIRPMRGKARPSVHGTGRAVDLGYAPFRTWPGSDRATMLRLVEFLVRNADELGLELLIDYSHTGGLGGGRSWKCDRHAWADNRPGVISGAGQAGSKWIHVELSPEVAHDADRIAAVVDKWNPNPPKPKKATA